jgi:hypothetical protein
MSRTAKDFRLHCRTVAVAFPPAAKIRVLRDNGKPSPALASPECP